MNGLTQSHPDCGRDSTEWLPLLRSIEDRVARDIADLSEAYDLSPFDLKLRLLLHLPRFWLKELENHDLVYKEIDRLAAKSAELQREFKEWASQEPVDNLERARTHVYEASEDMAAVIHERFHYIGSGHSGRHFALHFVGQRVPAALVTLSEMDVEKLRAHLPISQQKRSLLLSRMFCFRWAPRNTISYLLGQVAKWIKKEGQIESLVTWVNPNVGFHASSYRAANWIYLGSEPTTYRYIDGDYLTARQAFQKTQTVPLNIDTSKVHLAPLQIWCYRIGK